MPADPDATNHLKYHVGIYDLNDRTGVREDAKLETILNIYAREGWQFESAVWLGENKFMVVFSGLVDEPRTLEDSEEDGVTG